MEKYEKIYRLKIVLFSATLLVLAATSIYLSLNINKTNQLFSHYIDVAGEQRMLSQRLALAASSISNAQDADAYKKYIEKSYQTIRHLNKNQYTLDEIAEKNPKLNIVYTDYFNKTDDNGISRKDNIDAYTRLVKKYLKMAREFKFSPENLAVLQKNQIHVTYVALNTMLPIFQGNVTVFNDYITSQTKTNIRIKTFSTLLFVTIIILVFLWIFNPLKAGFIRNTLLLEEQKEHLEREKERYVLATNGTSIGIWDLDIKTNMFYWNPLLNQILGIEGNRDSHHNDFFQNLLHPKDKDAFNAAIQHCIKNKTKFDHVCRMEHADGHYIWVRISGKTTLGQNGRVNRLIGSLENITDRKLIEIQLNTFIEGIEQSGLCMALFDIKDPNKKFTYVTNALCDMVEHEKSRLLRANINVFTGPQTNMGDLDTIDSAIKDGQKLTIKILNYRQDGSSFWNRVSLHPIVDKNNDDTITHYAVIFEDLTKSIENERLEINRQRNESLGSIASSVAHEINNLLMPMTLSKDILESELKPDHDPFAMEQLNMMVEYANQARDIVAGILLFSRKETQDLQSTCIFEILDETIPFAQNMLQNKTKLNLESVDKNLKTVSCLINRTEFRQIITNLTKNAEDAFDREDGTITISMGERSINNVEKKTHSVTTNDFITVNVQDNGTGIDEHILPNIFEPMYSTKPVGQGTGLGLSVVYGILRSWGGFITVDSLLEVGTTFTLHIPIMHDDEDFSHLLDLIEIDAD